MKKTVLFLLSLVPLTVFADVDSGSEYLILRCPMTDAGLVAIFEINFRENSLVYSMEGSKSSQEYSFSLDDEVISIPGNEFGEEKIDLRTTTLRSRPGYASTWNSYPCRIAGRT